jgi:hypothetical protein
MVIWLLPRSVSFKGAIQTLEAFQPVIELQAAHDTVHRVRLYRLLLDAIPTHRVSDRPDSWTGRGSGGQRANSPQEGRYPQILFVRAGSPAFPG